MSNFHFEILHSFSVFAVKVAKCICLKWIMELEHLLIFYPPFRTVNCYPLPTLLSDYGVVVKCFLAFEWESLRGLWNLFVYDYRSSVYWKYVNSKMIVLNQIPRQSLVQLQSYTPILATSS